MRKIAIFTMLLSSLLILSACSEDGENIDSEEIVTDNDDNTTPLSTTSNTPQDIIGSEEAMVDSVIYPHNEVVSVNIEITDENFSSILNNPMAEEYVLCDITYNGYTLTNVAIRTKGNSSLRDVAQTTSNRYSFNVDLNLYEDQDLFGIDKLILNNIYMDPSYMAEYITYEALDSLDATSSRTTFVELSINGEYFGLYLSVEQVGNEFIEENFDYEDGELYKPETQTGADFNYTGENTVYSAFLEDKNNDDSTTDAVVNFLKVLDSGENLDSVFNVDSYLKYLAVSTYTVNLDSYQGGMSHNYYLYNNDGIFEWIAWDLNMSFNGFPMANISDIEAIEFLIDEPTIGPIDNYVLIDTILSNEEYLELYHEYLYELINGYFESSTFEARVTEIKEMIDSYVESDPSSFYTYTEFEEGIISADKITYGLLDFVTARTENITLQLSGEIPSTNDGNGNGTLTTLPGGGRPPGR